MLKLEEQRNKVAFDYRQEKIHPQNPDEKLMKYLYSLAFEWKKEDPLISPILTAWELSQLKKTTEYPLFVDLIKNDSHLKEKFFTWVLCDRNDVIPFIEFPTIIDKLIECRLSSRIGRYPESSLRIEKRGQEKHLCLPFEGKYYSILNPKNQIEFRGKYLLTIEEIFQIFANKELDVGNLEYMGEGICNWNIHHLAYFDAHLNQLVPIDMDLKNWWESMPPFQLLTRRQVIKKYGILLKPHEWVVAAVATRGRLSLDYEETHAFLEVAIPQNDGRYALYDFGKLASEYPKDALDRIAMMTKIVHATIAYPDDNIFYTQRQTGFYPFALKNREGRALMELLKEDILISRGKNMIYQIQSENCAKWVYTTLVAILGVKRVPDFFRMQLLDTEPKGPIAVLFAAIKLLPEKWQVPFLMLLHLPLGAFRRIWIIEEGKAIAKSLWTHHFFKTGQIFLPALLIAKVATKVINNVFQHFLLNIFEYAKFCHYGMYKHQFSFITRLCEALQTSSSSTPARFKNS